MKLTRRQTFGAVALLAAPTILRAQDRLLSLAEISAYFNDFSTATAQFTQINADDTISTGRLLIKRPGRIRFEYDPPEETLVMAGGGSLAIFDPRSNTGPERYPLNQTPLNLILERTVDLTRANMVTDHRFDGTATVVRAQDPENPQYGHIEMVFTGPPVELRQWVVTDDTGTETTVILQGLQTGMAVPDRNFNILAETRDRGLDEG